MAQSTIEVERERDVTPTADFDDETAKAKDLKNKGNDEYGKKEYSNALRFYTKGIKVNCKDDELNSQLYNNRATANFYLGNFRQSLNDAKAAIKLQPTYIKAIARGASACLELYLYEEANTWCEKGLAINKKDKTLSSLKARSLDEMKKLRLKGREEMKDQNRTESSAPVSMAQSTIEVERESDVIPTADFDDETLKAKAKDLKNKGNDEYGKKEYSNALRFYTEGIKVNCKDDELNSQLYNNRATANFYLGNFRQSLNDAKAAIKLQPTYIKAIARGASACLELHLYEEANTWCEKGLAIYKKDKTLSSLKARSLDEMKKLRLKGRQEMKDQERTDLLHKATGNAEDRAKQEKLHDSINKCPGDFKRAIHYHERDLKTAKESGDKAIERRAYWNLGNCYLSLSDYKKAIYYHELYLENAKKDKDRTDEGIAYCCLGNDYQKLGDFRKAIAFHEFHLNLAKEIGDRVGEGKAYGNLGNNYANLAYFKKAKDYLELQLDIAIKLGDRNGEQMAYFGLGGTFYALGDLQTATYYDNLYLKMAKERNDRVAEGQFYSSRGIQLQNLGDYRKAIHCHNIDLKLALEVGDKTGAAMAYCELGRAYQNLGDFKKAIEYSESCLKIAQEVGNRDAEGKAYCNLATTYRSLGDLKKAVNYGELSLKSAEELGNRDTELRVYSILGDCYESLVESKKAIACHEVCLKIAIEMGNISAQASTYSHLADSYHSLRNLPKAIELRLRSMEKRKDLGKRPREHINYYRLGCSYESLGDLTTAADCYRSSLRALNDEIRLQQDDECKISLRNMYRAVHTSLWQVLLKQEKEIEALSAAEQGRAQALKDLMKSKYGLEESSTRLEETAHDLSLSNSSSTIYIAYDEKKIVFWVSQNGSAVCYRSRTIMSGDGYHALEDMTKHFQSLVQTVSEEIGVRAGLKCEDRSLDNLRDETIAKEKLPEAPEKRSHHSHLGPNALKKLYDLIIGSLLDLLHGPELIIVPEGPLCLAPFAALVDSNSKHLSESFRIRVIPSLTSLKLITDCPGDYHCKTGALLVGDPWVQEFTYQGKKLHQLPCAREEVEMIGRILNTEPLIGTAARKDTVLQRLCSVALVHIAAHGRMETGEIALAPNSTRESGMPKEEDFLLTMKDVLSAKLRARLVVLSCCHSGRGEIKSEGVVGIARAFLGAGARSVLVSLWAIDDQATLEFMKRFYEQLVKGSSASEALNQAMKLMRESDDFNEVKYWAPFVLIGDDVTLDWNVD